MTQTASIRPRRRGRLFPEFAIPPEELARREAEKKIRYQRYREVFKRVSLELIDKHYNWFMIIEPNSGDYFIDPDEETAIRKARAKYPKGTIGIHRINETGACGTL
ncbi:MAG: hypothetical protein HC849_14040 [Oscillatoriales cyanobacterium RU_3_3]|nr:hypothetical protein [Microcoleus sp. SU_5_6]NJM61074.1 hypothetical protein [Oscillatoriales cyanobacterium RU_3_3]NJR21001.1 hypothetical protein [Richelia sp. CSU_2_1]